ncbi:MAG TPA: protease pro-enzyme activation domain-containing protein, partial [Candidatus Dormibacteraeota bacterium]|nr:protease pro-enzyme activation domain-containing protein [Candidatus Dormibacteraeota bacterium]
MTSSTLGLALALTACGGQNASLPWAQAGNGGATTESSVRTSTPGTPLISIPKLYGELAYTDVGRRPGNEPVRVALTLHYNHQAELDKFVARVNDPRSGAHRGFLTAQQFDDRFAPTRAQEDRVVRALQ